MRDRVVKCSGRVAMRQARGLSRMVYLPDVCSSPPVVRVFVTGRERALCLEHSARFPYRSGTVLELNLGGLT